MQLTLLKNGVASGHFKEVTEVVEIVVIELIIVSGCLLSEVQPELLRLE